MTLKKFNKSFQDEDHCRQYLFAIKRRYGYQCRRCGHKKCWKGRTEYHSRCIACDYDESLTAHTVFHKMQIPLLTAFRMVFQITVFKKGISSLELAKLFDVAEKTALRFRGKVQDAMGAWLSKEGEETGIEIGTKVDGILIMNRGENLNGLQRIDMRVKKYRKKSSAMNMLNCKSVIPIGDAIDQCHLVAGKYVDEAKDIRVWLFKSWLTGTHHHCSGKNIQKYVNEFLFRFNNRNRQNFIWHTLMEEMMLLKPVLLHDNAA